MTNKILDPPREIVTRAYRVMRIDHTPKSLNETWKDNVFLAPPFSKDVKVWVHKLLEGYKNCEIDEAILLVPCQPSSKWFIQIIEWSACMCTTVDKFFYVTPEGKTTSQHTSLSFAVILLSTREETRKKFFNVFSEIGYIWKRVCIEEQLR